MSSADPRPYPRMRRIPDALSPVAQQVLLNLAAAAGLAVRVDGEWKDLGSSLLARAERINAEFDALGL